MKRKGPSTKRIIILLLATVVLIFVMFKIITASLDAVLNNFFQLGNNTMWVSEKFYNQDGFKAYDDDSVDTYIGIDVSDHQKKIDWKNVKDSGIDFAMIRVGYRGAQEGILHEDKYLKENLKGAKKNNISIGVYFFSSAINKEEIEEEVDFILDLIQGYKLKYPIVFDMEPFDQGGRIDDLSQEEKTELTKYFCELIEEAGYTPMIYGNKHWLTKEIDLDKLPAGIPVWYAAYQDKPDVSIPFDMWQYSAYGTIDGISTDVDMNIYLKRK